MDTLIQLPAHTTPTIDAAALERDLRAHLRGEVRFDSGDRAMWASDAGNYRIVPLGVVLPRNDDDVLHTLDVCRRHGAPITCRGGGTGIPGQTVNAAVILDFSKYMTRILELNPAERYARVEPGVIPDQLRDAAKPHGLTFYPDPATHSRNTLGGMIANNSCGVHSMLAGETVDNVDELTIVLYDGTQMTVGATSEEELTAIIRAGGRRGEIYARLKQLRDRHADAIRREFPMIPRRVSGFNLPALLPEQGFHVARALVGTEGTCAITLAAKVRLLDSHPVRSLLVFGFPDIFIAADHIPAVAAHHPIGLEALDDTFLKYMHQKGMTTTGFDIMPEGHAWLLVEFGGHSKDETDAAARRCIDDLRVPSSKLFDDDQEERHIWHLREEGLGASAKVPDMPENHEGWEDAAVPPENLGRYLRDFQALLDRYHYEGPLYGHFGQGCVHTRLTFDLLTAGGIETWRRFLSEAADLVVRYGGSLSGEHGDGQARGELLPHMYSPEIIEAFREFKSIWDPDWKLNPGKVVDPYPVDRFLREGVDYRPPALTTHFHYPADRHSFAAASDRCVGAGVCRRLDPENGVMCPSYLATHDEKHSTRGRARLLNEMIRGDVIRDGWQSDEVRDALDLCLSCKGCKHDCPVQVDMATYKAEFLSHYYERRLRPRYAYASGLIHWWARAASISPSTANFFTQTPGLSAVAKWIAGYSQKRTIPPFAPQTFKQWFARREKRNLDKPEVILWADTFNNHFTPEVAQAAVEVLEHAGFRVRVPKAPLCCGRPLYDYGMLDTAKSMLRRILTTLRDPIRRGVPIVGLEPSCMTVFRDEMTNLLYGDEDAVRLQKQSFILAEFLKDKNYTPPQLQTKALVHGHCHHKSLLNFDAELDLLKKAGIETEVPNSGCCGMAGSFGYEADHYEVGKTCGERVLLPAVRATNKVVITDGFSCREMIQQETEARPLHFAQALQAALHDGHVPPPPPKTPRFPLPILAAGAALIGAVTFAVISRRSRRVL